MYARIVGSRRKEDAVRLPMSDAEDTRITNEAITGIAEILAKAYIRSRLTKADKPADAPSTPAETGPTAKQPSRGKPKSTRRLGPTDFVSNPPKPPQIQRMPPEDVPESVRAAVVERIEKLAHMTVRELQAEYVSVFGSAPQTSHKQNLYRRIAWEIQAQAEGRRVSEEARQYAMKLAEGTELYRRVADGLKKREAAQRQEGGIVPEATPTPPAMTPTRDPRLPEAGSFLIRKHGSKLFKVKVLESGFVYDNKSYKTLSAVAKRITGKNTNGFLFFALGTKPSRPHNGAGEFHLPTSK